MPRVFKQPRLPFNLNYRSFTCTVELPPMFVFFMFEMLISVMFVAIAELARARPFIAF